MTGQTLDRLVYMANQIARELAGQRPDDPAGATLDHLRHFWDPRMREAIVAYLEAGGEGLGEVARAAVASLAPPVGRPSVVSEQPVRVAHREE